MQKGVPQIMDVTSIRSILHNLSKKILPSRFETAQQPEPSTIQLSFKSTKSINWIEVCWQGDSPRIIEITRPEKFGSESTLSKQLRYGLKYMALISLTQDKFNRVIKLGFAKKPGDEIKKYLIFELMGKHSNIFYLDKSKKIIALGKQIKSSQSSFRSISTGSSYIKPPINSKKEPDENESFITWKDSLSNINESLKKCLINSYQGVSPILTTQIESHSKLSEKNLMNKNIQSISDEYLKEIFKSWIIWINRFKNNKFEFSNFENYNYCVWFSSKETKGGKYIDLSEGLTNYYDYFLKLKKIESLTQSIDGILYKQMKTVKKNFNIQSNLLLKSENHEFYKEKADNIFANQIINKTDIIEAQNLYKKSKKLKRAKDIIKTRINLYKNKLDRLEEFSEFLENLNSLNNEKLITKINLLSEIKDEINLEFNIKSMKARGVKKISDKSKSTPMQINTQQGLAIQIGRNMRQNDLISFKYSKKGDLWFHAQDSPGSHVVLKSSSKLAIEEDIQIAADIASLFSKAKRNNKVPVNLVKIKDLKRITNGGTGCVSFKEVEIIWGIPSRAKNYIKENSVM